MMSVASARERGGRAVLAAMLAIAAIAGSGLSAEPPKPYGISWQAIRAGTPVQDLPCEKLRDQLLADGAKL